MKNKTIACFCVLLFFFIISVKYISGLPSLLFMLPLIGFVLWGVYFKSLKSQNFQVIFYAWLVVFLLFAIMSGADNLYRSVYYLFLGATTFYVSYVLFLYPKFALKISWVLLLSYLSAMYLVVLLSPSPASITLNEVFVGSSRNLVGAIALFLQILYSASYYRVYQRLPLALIWLSFVLIFISFGRASILAGLMLLIIHSQYLFKIKYVVALFLTVCLLYLMFWSQELSEQLLDFITAYSNFSQGTGTENPRLDIMYEYASSTTYFTFLSGHPISDSLTAMSLGNNPHSSYIRAHSYYGVISVLFILFFLVVIVSRVNQATVIYLYLMIVYLFRIAFEPLGLFDIFDVLLFYLFFLIYFNQVSVKK